MIGKVHANKIPMPNDVSPKITVLLDDCSKGMNMLLSS